MRQQLAEQAAYTDAGVIVALAADLLNVPLIVAVQGMIQSEFHESGEGNWPGGLDFSANGV
jgi:hypothetical protein